MDDTIKRSDAINLCEKWRNRTNEHHDKDGWYIAATLLNAIKELPSADRPQGNWILFPMGYLVCSVCGSHHSNSKPCNYCDNCGAKMKGADDER